MKKNCSTFETDINEYFDSESPTNKKRRLLTHMAQCSECRSLWESLISLRMGELKSARQTTSASLDLRILRIAHGNGINRLQSTAWTRFFRSRISVPVPVGALVTVAFIVILTLLIPARRAQNRAINVGVQTPPTAMSMPTIRIEVE